MSRARKAGRTNEPSALALIEEAVHLLRCAPVSTLAIYLAGAAPWTLGFLFFWAHTTWFAPSGETLAWSALGLVVVFAGLKTAQAEFCARLLAQRLGDDPPVWSWRRGWRLATGQLAVQAWGLVVLPVALIVVVPAGLAYSYFQHACALGGAGGGEAGGDPAGEARALTLLWPRQNHLGLLFAALFALAVWINCATGFYALPWLANKLLGVENLFGFNGWWALNTTFLASVSALTWVAIDPLVKAFYVLRVFYGRSQRTGEDIRVDLGRATRNRRALRSAGAAGSSLVALAAAVIALSAAPRSGAAESAAPLVEAATPPSARGAAPMPRVEATPARGVDPASLDRALDDVLKRRDFQWQLRPRRVEGEKKAEGPLLRFLRQGVETVQEIYFSIRRLVWKVRDWIDGLIPKKDNVRPDKVSTSGWGGMFGALRVFLYVLIGAAVVLIGVVIFLMVRHGRRQAGPALTARAIEPATPDLRDENVHASQMPADGWLALAREQMAKGEWRLALRALYLATLARLAAEGLVSLAKFKTNLDYERELRRRALTRPEEVARFTARRGEFEAVWYGRAQAGEASVRAWLGEFEREARPSS